MFAGLLASMTYLGFEKVEHGLRLSDVTLTGIYNLINNPDIIL